MQAASLCRRFRQTPSFRQLSTLRVPSGPSSQAFADIDAFRQNSFIPQKPFCFKNDGAIAHAQPNLPAASKWFTATPPEAAASPSTAATATLSPYLDDFLHAPLPYELYSPSVGNTPPVVSFCDWLSQSQDLTDQVLAGILHAAAPGHLDSGSFFQLHAPLKLLAKALEFNERQLAKGLQPLLLYIAQASVTDLPQGLREDLPTPTVVQKAGRGDVYDSSIWLGTEPTYTPLHRDPNPNLFCQLCRQKVVRLLPPELGDRVFFEVQVQIKQQGSSRMRGKEMMEGAERAVLHEAVWSNEKLDEQLHEAELDAGDALFIPKGWWHSVKSVGSGGDLNGSVNWWFR